MSKGVLKAGETIINDEDLYCKWRVMYNWQQDGLTLYNDKQFSLIDKYRKVAIFLSGYKNEKEALKAAGFSAKLSEGDNIIVKLSELSAMPIMKSRKIPHNIGTISELTLRKFRKGISKAISRGRKGLCEDLSYLSMGWFEGDVSCYSMDEDEISGFLLFHKLPSEMLSIQLMIGLDNNYDKNLLGMVRKFIVSMEEKYPPETKIVLNRHNSASLQLAEKLLPRGFGIPVYAGNREE